MPAVHATPEVSVLMSCYNGARWLAAAIDSVLGQTFGAFELILIDDGSSDDSWTIITKYSESDGRVVAIRKENTGLADSLNLGIRNARAPWIARIDQDDICERSRLSEQLAFVKSNPAVVLLGTGCVEVDEGGNALRTHFYPADHRRLVWHLEHLMSFFPHSSAFYSVDAVRKVGGYNARIRRAEDWRLWLELSRNGLVASIRTPLVRIRKHPSQMSRDNSGKSQLSDATAATVCHYLAKAGLRDPSADPEVPGWTEFTNWIEQRMLAADTFRMRNEWSDARASFFAEQNEFIGLLQFARRILASGHATTLLWERYRGSALPERLAHEWADLTNQALRRGATT